MIKRILVVEPAEFERRTPIKNTLESLGYECSFFNYRRGILYTNRIMRRLTKSGPLRFLKNNTISKINAKLFKAALDFKPDLVLVAEGENISSETVSKIRQEKIITANWFTDHTLRHWPLIQKLAPAYDYFFMNDTHFVEKLKELGLKNIFYLPIAVAKIYEGSPFDDRKNIYNISFVGSYNPEIWKKREEFLAAAKDFGVNVWGPKSWKKTLLKDYYRGEASGEKMFKIYRQSKIVFDIPWDNKGGQAASGTSLRPQEAMISGACAFVYDIREEVGNLFKKNEEYVPFLTDEELKTKVKYYLENGEERERIARNGFDAVMAKHTYSVRMNELMKTIEKNQ